MEGAASAGFVGKAEQDSTAWAQGPVSWDHRRPVTPCFASAHAQQKVKPLYSWGLHPNPSAFDHRRQGPENPGRLPRSPAGATLASPCTGLQWPRFSAYQPEGGVPVEPPPPTWPPGWQDWAARVLVISLDPQGNATMNGIGQAQNRARYF